MKLKHIMTSFLLIMMFGGIGSTGQFFYQQTWSDEIQVGNSYTWIVEDFPGIDLEFKQASSSFAQTTDSQPTYD